MSTFRTNKSKNTQEAAPVFSYHGCSGPDHHTMNFVRSKQQKMHHIAFQLKDWAHVQRACDHLYKHNIPLIWGPGRHGVGHNIFTYHLDPDGQRVELFTELDIMLNEDLGYFEPRPWHHDGRQKNEQDDQYHELREDGLLIAANHPRGFWAPNRPISTHGFIRQQSPYRD